MEEKRLSLPGNLNKTVFSGKQMEVAELNYNFRRTSEVAKDVCHNILLFQTERHLNALLKLKITHIFTLLLLI